MNTVIKLKEWQPGVAMAQMDVLVTQELLDVVLRLARLEVQPKAEAVGGITLGIDVSIRAHVCVEVCKDFKLPAKDEVLVKGESTKGANRGEA